MMLLLLAIICCLQYSNCLSFKSTELTENFIEESDEECFIQSSFGTNSDRHALSDTHMFLNIDKDRGVVLSAKYASESKTLIDSRVTQELKLCEREIVAYFTNISHNECLSKNQISIPNNYNTTISGSIQILIKPYDENVSLTLDYVVSPLVNITSFNINSSSINCTNNTCNMLNYNENDTCIEVSFNYTIKLIAAKSELDLTQSELLQMLTLIVSSSNAELGTMCYTSCDEDNDNNNTQLLTTDYYFPTVNITIDNDTNTTCLKQVQRAIKLNNSLAIQLSVSNITTFKTQQYTKCNNITPNYLVHYDKWVNLSCYQQLLNNTHCNNTIANTVFSLYMFQTNETLMLVNESFPQIYMFQDYNNPLRAKDIAYVHCQRLHTSSTVSTRRAKRSVENSHVDRTSNYMLCIMRGNSDDECNHLNNRKNRVRRAPPLPPPRVVITDSEVRMNAGRSGSLQHLHEQSRTDARRAARKGASKFSTPTHFSSMDNVASHVNNAREDLYARVNKNTRSGSNSPIVRSPLNDNEVIYSLIKPHSVSATQLNVPYDPTLSHSLSESSVYATLSFDTPRTNYHSDYRMPQSISDSVIYSDVKYQDVNYASIKHKVNTPPISPNRNSLSPPISPRGSSFSPPISPRGSSLSPPISPRGSSLLPPPLPDRDYDSPSPPLPDRDYLPPPIPPRSPTNTQPKPTKLQNFFNKFKTKPGSTGGACGGPKRTPNAACSLNMMGKPFSGNGKTPPKISNSPLGMLDPDMDGVYGIGNSGSLGNGEHIRINKAKPNKNPGLLGNNAMMGAMTVMVVSQQMSMATRSDINDIISGKYENMDQGRAISLVVLQKLDEIGGMMASGGAMAAMMGGGPVALAVAAVGLATQTIVGFVTMSMQIYDIRFPRDPPVDPILEKHTEYANMMNSPTAGNTWCLMPESVLHVTISFDDIKTTIKSDSSELWVPTYKTVIKVGYNPDVIFNSELQVTCAGGGQLRFNDFNINSVARKISSTTGGSSVYQVFGIGSMISKQDIIKGTCGGSKDPNLLIIREEISSNDMVLLRKRGPGEPEGTENMYSTVCDEFPFKKFYVATPGCSADTSKTHISWTTCSMLFRKGIWNSVNNTWMVANPFVSKESDRKIFVFKRRDFRNSFPIKPNLNSDHAKLCDNADQPFLCRLPDPMIVADTKTCNNKLRFFRVFLSSGDTDGYNSRDFIGYMLTCPLNTIAMYIMKRGSEETNLKVHDVDMFGSVRKFFLLSTNEHSSPIVWIFCKHSTKVGYESDVIELQLENNHINSKSLNLKTSWLNDDHTRFAMYNISRRGPKYQGAYIYTDVKNHPDYRKQIHSSKPVKFIISDGSNNINEEWSISQLEGHWVTNTGGVNSWNWALRGCKTISSLQVTFGLCNITYEGELDMVPLGWWVWSHLDQIQQGSTTKYVPSTEWLFQVKKEKATINGKEYTHKMKDCTVKLSMVSKKLSIDCDNTDITTADLTNSDTCLIVSPASDQCNSYDSACGTRTKEWYNLGDKRTQWESGTRYMSNWHNAPGSEPQIAHQFFCQDEGVYWSHIDNNKRYSVIVYSRPLDAKMPVIASYQSGNTLSDKDFVIEASKLKIVEKIQDRLSRLFDLTKDPMAEAINGLNAGLIGTSVNITRINIDIHDLVEAKRVRDDSIAQLTEELDNALMDLTIDALKNTEWFKTEIEVAKYKCCYISVNDSSVTSIDKDIYECPDFEYFMEEPNNPNFTKILAPDGNYHEKRVLNELFESPYLICLDAQDIVFGNNSTFQEFKQMLFDEMLDEEFILLSDNITYNALLMENEINIEQPVDGYFQKVKYDYMLSPDGYSVTKRQEINHNAILVLSFSMVVGIVIVIIIWYVVHKCKRVKQYVIQTRKYKTSDIVEMENVPLDKI